MSRSVDLSIVSMIDFDYSNRLRNSSVELSKGSHASTLSLAGGVANEIGSNFANTYWSQRNRKIEPNGVHSIKAGTFDNVDIGAGVGNDAVGVPVNQNDLSLVVLENKSDTELSVGYHNTGNAMNAFPLYAGVTGVTGGTVRIGPMGLMIFGASSGAYPLPGSYKTFAIKNTGINEARYDLVIAGCQTAEESSSSSHSISSSSSLSSLSSSSSSSSQSSSSSSTSSVSVSSSSHSSVSSSSSSSSEGSSSCGLVTGSSFVLNGGYTWNNSALAGNYNLFFNGTSGYGRFACGSGSPTDSPRLQSNFTVCIRVKNPLLTQNSKFLVNKMRPDHGASQWGIRYLTDGSSLGHYEFFAEGYSGGTNPSTGSSLSVSDTNWHTLCYRKSGSTWDKSIDGPSPSVINSSASFTLDSTTGATLLDGQMYLASLGGLSSFFQCYVDEFAIWHNVALSNDDVARWHAGLQVRINPSHRWLFNEATGLVAVSS